MAYGNPHLYEGNACDVLVAGGAPYSQSVKSVTSVKSRTLLVAELPS
ncbi:hypothetical protein QT971_15745 [Microcoleus sp. herbarium19]